jgi:hypothetical protein
MIVTHSDEALQRLSLCLSRLIAWLSEATSFRLFKAPQGFLGLSCRQSLRPTKADAKKNPSKEEHKLGQALGLVAQEKGDNSDQVWILDFGASSHMTMKRIVFHTYIALNKPTIIIIGDGTTIKAEGVGSVFL